MKAIALLAFVGSALGALVPFGPGIYWNSVSPSRTAFPVQRLDGTTLGAQPPQRYLVYDVPQVNTVVRTIPTAIFRNGRPVIAHIPTTYNYYGTPVYDFRFPLNPIPPSGSIPSTPGYVPKPGKPQPPTEPADDDGIEKLDEKVEPLYDPLGEAAGAADSEEVSAGNDSIAVEAA